MSATSGSSFPQQREAARFRSSVSENLLQSMQANINYLLAAILPVGSIIDSMLTQDQMDGFVGVGNWVIAAGQDVSDSQYTLTTGYTSVPDLRGVLTRGKNNGRSASTGNADGDLALGTYQADQLKSHDHLSAADGAMAFVDSTIRGDGVIERDEGSEYRIETGKRTGATGGNETRGRCVTVNKFIRIN